MEPITIIKPLQEQKIKKIPSTVTFECEISKANLSVQWLKNGTPLEKSAKYKTESSAKIYRLVISDVTDEDDADYTIAVKDTDLKSTAALIVESAYNISPKSMYFSISRRYISAVISSP